MASVPAVLKPFFEKLNAAKDDAAVSAVIEQILSDDNVYAFGEFFDNDKIKALQKGSPSHFQLLEIFAYGRYQDYKAKEGSLPKLNQKQETKLRLLTLVSLASDNRVIPYSSVIKQLGFPDERSAEELLIQALYKGVIQGKLDSAKHLFKVESAIGRDVRPGEVDQLFKTLEKWQGESANLLKIIDTKMAQAGKEQAMVEQNKLEHVTYVEGLKATIKMVLETEMEGGMGMGMGMGGGHPMMMGMGGHPMMGGKDFHHQGGKGGKDKRNKGYM
jgi:COP9 signalosome complex subunit 7